MSTVRIIAAGCEEHVLSTLIPHSDFRIVRQVISEPDLFVAVRRELRAAEQSPDDPLVIITTFDSDDFVNQAYSRLLAEFPELIVYYVRLDETIRCRAVTEIAYLRTDELLNDLRRVCLGMQPAERVVRDSPRGLDP